MPLRVLVVLFVFNYTDKEKELNSTSRNDLLPVAILIDACALNRSIKAPSMPLSHLLSQVWHGAVECLKQSVNWIVIFSQGSTSGQERKTSCSGLFWLLFLFLNSPLLLMRIYFLYIFCVTPLSLNSNLSGWKETCCCSLVYFLTLVSNRSVVPHSPNINPTFHFPLSGEAVSSWTAQSHTSSFTAAWRAV